MKLTNVILSQAIRLLRVKGPAGGSVYVLDLVRALESRYGFFEGPKALSDYDFAKGVTFLHGHLNKRFVIDRFQIFETGILAETRATVEECDEFLNDVIEWARKEFSVSVDEEGIRGSSYLSQVEVQSSVSLGIACEQCKRLSCQLTEILRSYGQSSPEFEVSGIKLHGDVTNVLPLRPVEFAFERRAGLPYGSGLYFSSAPLRTADHMRFLNEIEAVLSVSPALPRL